MRLPNNPFNPIAAKTRLRVNGTLGSMKTTLTEMLGVLEMSSDGVVALWWVSIPLAIFFLLSMANLIRRRSKLQLVTMLRSEPRRRKLTGTASSWTARLTNVPALPSALIDMSRVRAVPTVSKTDPNPSGARFFNAAKRSASARPVS